MVGRVNAHSIRMVLIAFVLAAFAILPPAFAESEAAEVSLLSAERFAGLSSGASDRL